MPAWTAPRTWVTSEVVTATQLNTHVRDNLINTHSEYGTTLPVTPSDGQMAILTDSTTDPHYHWQVRYNASNTSAHKWEFIGGTPYWSTPAADISHANITTYRISAVTLTVPVAGLYEVVLWASHHTGSGGSAAYLVAVNSGTSFTETILPATSGALYYLDGRTLAASDVLAVAYRAITGGITYNLKNACINLRPVRLT